MESSIRINIREADMIQSLAGFYFVAFGAGVISSRTCFSAFFVGWISLEHADNVYFLVLYSFLYCWK